MASGNFGQGIALGGRVKSDIGRYAIEGMKAAGASRAKQAKEDSDAIKDLMKDMDTKGIHPALAPDAARLGAEYVDIIRKGKESGNSNWMNLQNLF